MTLRKIDAFEIKRRSLQLLQFLAEYCENNHINYILSDGTLLGAIRHKGFIPWDMDIDISMLRNDYEKFLEIWQDTEDYAVISHEKDKNFELPFAKFVDMHTECYEYGNKTVKGGIWIDIFPLDSVPIEEKVAENYYKKNCQLFDKFVIQKNFRLNLKGINYFTHKIFYSLKLRDLSFFIKSTESCLNKLVRFAKQNNCDNCKNVNNNVSIYYRGSPYRKFGFSKYCVTDYVYGEFENLKFRIPKDYDAVLKCWYNNYMQLPPKEKQVDTHGIECFLID